MRVAVIGTGGIANRHLHALAQLPDLELVGHLSATPARAEAQARQWGGSVYTAVAALLDRGQPDAVWVCVTPDRHGAIEEALIARAVPFFVEKPLAADLATPRRIAGMLSQQALIVGVGYDLRALDTLPLVRRLLAERPARMLIGAYHVRMPAASWWRSERLSGGQIVEQATHLVDLARLLVGEGEVLAAAATRRPNAAYPDSDIADVTAALLRFGGDVPATLTATCLLAGRQVPHLQCVCEGRVLTLTDRVLRIETGTEVEEVAAAPDRYLREDAAFLHAVRERDPRHLLSTYADALRTHELCCAIRATATPLAAADRT